MECVQAKQLVGSTLLVREHDRPELDEGEYYTRDLVGVRVILKVCDYYDDIMIDSSGSRTLFVVWWFYFFLYCLVFYASVPFFSLVCWWILPFFGHIFWEAIDFFKHPLYFSFQETGEFVGTVANVYNYGASDLLHVKLDSSLNILDKTGKPRPTETVVSDHLVWVPFVEAIVPHVDMNRREIQITPPKGLLELNLRFDERSKKERRQLVRHTHFYNTTC